MLKRLLVALDADIDTKVATQYALDIAQRYDAEIHGVAVVDTGYHDTGGGVGSMYYQEKLHAQETAQGRTEARRLIEAFEEQVRSAGGKYGDFIQEGNPTSQIVEDMKYYDLLIIGHDPHFVYSKPGRATGTLEELINHSISPTLVVENTYRPVSRIVVAYDGSPASARTLQRFAQLRPFGEEAEINLLHIADDDPKESDRILSHAKVYLEAHGLRCKTVGLSGGHPDKQIVSYAADIQADLVVVGAHSVSKIRKMAFGSTTASLLKNSPIALFMDS